MKDLIKFLNNSPTAFEAVENITGILKENDYKELKEEAPFRIAKGGRYYVTRNGSSVIAFNVGSRLDDPSLQITASHGDCPTFKIKPESVIFDNGYLKLNTEVYGGALFYPWLDRPLSIAGRLIVKDKRGRIKVRNFVHGKPFCLIPSEAIHFNRKANDELKLNAQIDLLPICALKKKDLKEYLKEATGENVLSYDLYLYPLQSAYVWGMEDEFISSFHLDDLECAYTCLKGFVNVFNDENINVYCCFDNEETGSLTRQGAASDFLQNVLKRVCEALGLDYYLLTARGMLLSCDNAQGLHPNHPEKYDMLNRPLLNGGIVIKSNANQSYTSDALSSAIFKDLLDRNKIPNQYFTNRSDVRGGSTLGNISNSHVSLLSVDIGMPQLAMHSILETAGTRDAEYMIKGIKAFYKAHLQGNDLK